MATHQNDLQLPTTFSHREQINPGDPHSPWDVAVDTDGQRWRQNEDGTRWVKLPSPPPTDNSISGGSPMTASQTSAQSSEVTNVPTAIAVLERIATAHASLGTGEGFLGSLRSFDVGEPDQQLYRDALELSGIAGQSWADAAASVRRNNDPVGQAYSTSPGAGNKAANTNE